MVLFYADVLGMKARWSCGVATIRAAYDRLEQLVSEVLIETATGEGAEGGVQSDAVAVTFPTTEAALTFGRRLFIRTFSESTDGRRLWLRGVLVLCDIGGLELAREANLDGVIGGSVRSRQFCDELLEAINVEQAFKGPRLLIAESLVTQGLQDLVALSLGARSIIPLKRLKHSAYPSGDWRDVLYLYPELLDDESMDRRGYEVGLRQRWASQASSAGSQDEFEHVSHLALVWTQCDALYHAMALRAGT